MKAIGYIRVSTDRQELGPEAQRMAIEAKGKELGVEVELFEDIGVSGSVEHDSRQGLSQALARLCRGDVLIVAKLDRLSRDLLNQLVIERIVEKEGARIISCAKEGTDNDGHMGKLIRQILGAVAEYERAIIRERTRATVKVKKARGEILGHPPFGYRKEGKVLVQDDHEQTIIEMIRQHKASGYSVRRIAEVLNENAIKTKQGKMWRATQVQRILNQ